MELFKLIPSTWKPGATVNNFNSLVWTERYQTAGDFQLIVENDVSILTLLPVGTLISHTDTFEIMIVENHEIDRDANKNLKVIVSGRSFETFTEDRITSGSIQPIESGGAKINETITGTSAAIAQYLLRYALQTGYAIAADVLSNLSTRLEIRTYDASLLQIIKRGDVYGRLLEYLQLANIGVKTVRPNGAQTTFDIVVYDGLDKRLTVIFYAQNEDLLDAKYFWSNVNYRNYATVSTKNFAHEYRQRDLGADVTGLDRKIMYVEDTDLQGSYVFGSTDGIVAARAQTEMGYKKKIQLISATVSKTAKPKFKLNYDVGDLVTVFGEFQITAMMRVIEHVLTKDDTGINGYPSLGLA